MVTITLPPELELAIVERARRKGTTPELMTIDTLRGVLLPDSQEPIAVGSLADYLGDFIGCLDSSDIVPGGARMSENVDRKFAEGMEQKRREGRL